MNLSIITDHIGDIILLLLTSGCVFEIIPIKINPISCIIRKFGKIANKELSDKLVGLDCGLQELKKEFLSYRIENMRFEILAFSTSIMLGEKKTAESFSHIIKIHTEYEQLIKENDLKNGEVDEAFLYISEMNLQCRKDNSYLKGKE